MHTRLPVFNCSEHPLTRGRDIRVQLFHDAPALSSSFSLRTTTPSKRRSSIVITQLKNIKKAVVW